MNSVFYSPIKANETKACPCASGRSYGVCCGPVHADKALASTPQQLMRARYSAFALQNEAFVMATWHPDYRPSHLDLNDGTRYVKLTVHHFGPNTVEFTVSMKLIDGRSHRFRERSYFIQLEGQWVYVNGEYVNGEEVN